MTTALMPSVEAVLTDPSLTSWERGEVQRLKAMQQSLVDVRQRRGEFSRLGYRYLIGLYLDRCRWQRQWIADLNANDEGD